MVDGRAGARLREARRAAGLTVEQLAKLADIDKGHLSRVETGQRNLPETLARELARHLGIAADEILIAGGRLPLEVIGALASETLAGALSLPQLYDATLPALRRLHLARVAEDHLMTTFGSATEPPRVARLLATAGVTLDRGPDPGILEVSPGRFAVGPDVPADHTALIGGHLAAHQILGDAGCDIGGFGETELEATALASFLLAPRPALRSVALRLRNELKLQPWGDVTTMITLAAERFALPVWVAARRLSEDGLLGEMVEVPDL